MAPDPTSEVAERDWPPPWYRTRPEVLTYEGVLSLVRQQAVLETKLDTAIKDIGELRHQVRSLELARAETIAKSKYSSWIWNSVWGAALAIIGALGAYWGTRSK